MRLLLLHPQAFGSWETSDTWQRNMQGYPLHVVPAAAIDVAWGDVSEQEEKSLAEIILLWFLSQRGASQKGAEGNRLLHCLHISELLPLCWAK